MASSTSSSSAPDTLRARRGSASRTAFQFAESDPRRELRAEFDVRGQPGFDRSRAGDREGRETSYPIQCAAVRPQPAQEEGGRLRRAHRKQLVAVALEGDVVTEPLCLLGGV